MMLNNITLKIQRQVQEKTRRVVLWTNGRRIDKNTQRTILCNMCLGGVISHDFGLRFNSPTVNLMIPAREFVSMLQDINQIDGKIEIKEDAGKPYPVGILNEKYVLHFIHFKTFQDAVDTWHRRSERMDKNKPYIILVETTSCSYDDLVKFDKLPYKHKIALVHRQYPEIHCSVVIDGFDGMNLHGEILSYTGLLGKRMYDQVNWKEFLELNTL